MSSKLLHTHLPWNCPSTEFCPLTIRLVLPARYAGCSILLAAARLKSANKANILSVLPR